MIKRLALASIAVPLLLVFAGCGASGATPASPTAGPAASDPSFLPGVTAHGIGRIAGTPDVMTITVGVQTTAAHASDALAANSSRAAAVIAGLKSHGVAEADIQTSALSLYPQYDNGSAIRGYNVTNTVTATLRDLAKAGATIDAAVTSAGDAGRLQGVSFSFSDNSDLLAHARADAVAHAKIQAQQLATAAGAKLGTLRSVSEDASNAGIQSYSGASAADAAPTPVQPGSQQLTVQVTVVWNLA